MNRRSEIKKRIGQNLKDLYAGKILIFDTKTLPAEHDELPCLNFFISSEESEISSDSTLEARKKAYLSIELLIEDCAELPKILDQISAEIETKLATDRFLGDIVNSIHLKHTEIVFNRDTDTILGLLKMSYEIIYFSTTDFKPGLVNFEKLKTSIVKKGEK